MNTKSVSIQSSGNVETLGSDPLNPISTFSAAKYCSIFPTHHPWFHFKIAEREAFVRNISELNLPFLRLPLISLWGWNWSGNFQNWPNFLFHQMFQFSKPTDNGNVVIVWALAAKSGHKQFYEHSPGIAYYCPSDLKAGKWNLGGNKERISSR